MLTIKPTEPRVLGPVVYTLANEMRTVRYTTRNPWVGKMVCPECGHTVRAWRSSGMSDCCPHFYCDSCSNAIQRDEDKKLSWDEQSEDVLAKIAGTLPRCPCGGNFRPGENPKCPKCKAEFKHQDNPVQRLTDPHLILVNGACFFSDRKPYRIKIYGF